jgi:hypothetical protein
VTEVFHIGFSCVKSDVKSSPQHRPQCACIYSTCPTRVSCSDEQRLQSPKPLSMDYPVSQPFSARVTAAQCYSITGKILSSPCEKKSLSLIHLAQIQKSQACNSVSSELGTVLLEQCNSATVQLELSTVRILSRTSIVSKN